MTLEERYASDSWTLEFYREKLLEPGWAGDLDSVELEYIKSNLKQSPSLRRRWDSVRLQKGFPKVVYVL